VYRDPHPKPELLYAVTPFEALAGLREARSALRLLGLLAAPALDPLRYRLTRDHDVAGALAMLAGWPPEQRRPLLAAVLDDVRAVLLDPDLDATLDDDARQALIRVVRLADQHAGDPWRSDRSCCGSTLEPGDTLFVPAGVPHAYLDGVAWRSCPRRTTSSARG
jgi:mannose-6-phosphate isomerase